MFGFRRWPDILDLADERMRFDNLESANPSFVRNPIWTLFLMLLKQSLEIDGANALHVFADGEDSCLRFQEYIKGAPGCSGTWDAPNWSGLAEYEWREATHLAEKNPGLRGPRSDGRVSESRQKEEGTGWYEMAPVPILFAKNLVDQICKAAAIRGSRTIGQFYIKFPDDTQLAKVKRCGEFEVLIYLGEQEPPIRRKARS